MATPLDINQSIQSYLKSYQGAPSTPEALAQVPAQVNLAAAPNLESLSTLVNRINQTAQQQANLSRTGYSPEYDQGILQNIYNMSQGYVSPETVSEAESAAAQQWGGAGFGVDTPAMQSAVRRTLGLTREQQQQQAAQEYAQYLGTHPSAPIYDVSKMMVTPADYQVFLKQQQDQALALAQLQERMSEARGTAYANLYSKLYKPTIETTPRPFFETNPLIAERARQRYDSGGPESAAAEAARQGMAGFGWGGGYYPSQSATNFYGMI